MALNLLRDFATALLLLILQDHSPPSDCNGSYGEKNEDELVNKGVNGGCSFQMPLHYPRYVKSDYEKMGEWQVNALLRQYGLHFNGSLDDKRNYAMGAFLWPDQF